MVSVNSDLCHASHYPDGAAKASMPHLGHEGHSLGSDVIMSDHNISGDNLMKFNHSLPVSISLSAPHSPFRGLNCPHGPRSRIRGLSRLATAVGVLLPLPVPRIPAAVRPGLTRYHGGSGAAAARDALVRIDAAGGAPPTAKGCTYGITLKTRTS